MKRFIGIIFALFGLMLLGYFQVSRTQAAGLTASNATELIAAINTANLSPEADVIQLTGNIVLNNSNYAADTTNGLNGLPSITSEIIINGNGNTISRAVGSTAFRIIHAGVGANLWLHDATITGGDASAGSLGNRGGGVYAVNATLTLTETNIVTNSADEMGAGVYADNTNLKAINVNVDNNQITNITYGYGVGIYFSGSSQADLVRTSVSNNLVDPSFPASGIGMYIGNGNGTFSLYESQINNNTATIEEATGGGIFIEDDFNLRLLYSSVNGNSGVSGGGGIYGRASNVNILIRASTIDNNTATAVTAGGQGGGLWFTAASNSIQIEHSSISGNVADAPPTASFGSGNGGGIYLFNQSNVSIENSVIANNVVRRQSSGSSSCCGGGIWVLGGGNHRLINTTVSGNIIEDPSGLGNSGTRDGAGIYYNASNLLLNHVTIVNNRITLSNPARGAGIYKGSPSSINIGNSLIANNNVNGVPSDCFTVTPLNSLGFNHVSDSTNCNGLTSSDITNTPATFNPLADNGGPTWTHAITSSPPIDAVNQPPVDPKDENPPPPTPSTCNTPTDQRGAPRPQGFACDIGAYEANAIVPPFNFAPAQTVPNFVVTYTTPNNTPISDNLFTLNTVVDPDANAMSAFPLTPPENGSVTINPDGTFTYTPFSTASGPDTFQYVVCDEIGYCSIPITASVDVAALPVPIYDSNPIPSSTITLSGNQGDNLSATLDIRNIGDAGSILELLQTSTHAGFNISPLPVTLTPTDGISTITITCDAPVSGTSFSETLTIQTNEVGLPDYSYTLVCESVVPPAPIYLSDPVPNSSLAMSDDPMIGLSQTLNISNVGDAGTSLDVVQVGTLTNFTISALPTSLQSSDGLFAVTITCVPSGTQVTETLVLQSNEPSSPQYSYTLLCEAAATPTPEITPEVTPEITPEVTPEITPEVTPEITPEVTPEITPEVTPEITPEVTPEITPEVTPEITPEVTPEITPEVTALPTDDPSGGDSANVSANASGDVAPSFEVFDPAISKIGFLQPGQVGVTGEQIEWLVIVRNTGNIVGNNVIVSDTLVSDLRIDRVEAPNANVSINGQTVIVVYPTLNVGQTVQFSIFTTVLNGVQVDNTVCVNASNQAAEECFTGSVISALPNTGEIPFWRNWMMWLGASLLIFVSGLAVLRYRNQLIG